MPSSINNNLMAANVANNLNSHYGRLATSVERLSSGLRINSAADDAAGLAIRELMRADVAAINQGVRNANDAISMIQMADGALGVIDEKLIRMKELAEQAATGTYSSTQRLMIHSEFVAMGEEIDRIARSTAFNGIKLLDGSLSGTHDGSGMNSTGKMKIHFGAANDSAEDYYYIQIANCTLVGLGLTNNVQNNTNTSAEQIQKLSGEKKYSDIGFGPNFNELNDLPHNNSETTISHGGVRGDNPLLNITDLNQGEWYCEIHEFYATLMPPILMEEGCQNSMFLIPAGTKNIVINQIGNHEGDSAPNFIQLFTKDGKHLAGRSPLPNFEDIGALPNDPTDLSSNCDYMGFTIDKYDPTSINTGPAIYDKGETLFFTTYNGMNIGFSGDGSGAVLSRRCRYEILTIDEATEDLIVWLPGVAGSPIKYYANGSGISDVDKDRDSFSNDIISIETQEKAQQALERIDDAIVAKDKVRANLGAIQNRLENTVTNLTIQGENLQAAESRISDTDISAEMTTFVRNQVLTQSAVAMLGQANSYPHMLSGLITW